MERFQLEQPMSHYTTHTAAATSPSTIQASGSWLSSGTQVKHFPFYFALGSSKVMERNGYRKLHDTLLVPVVHTGVHGWSG